MNPKNGARRLLDITADAVCKTTISKIAAMFAIESNSSESDSPPRKKVQESQASIRKRKGEREKELIKIRKEIDGHLAGRLNQVRHSIVATFIETSDSLKDPEIGLAFFNCLLNYSFSKVDLTVVNEEHPFKFMDPIELITIVTEHCPDLEVLKVSFGSKTRPVKFESTFGSLLKGLKRLHTLSLNWSHSIAVPIDTYGFDYFFTNLGTNLPNLTSLEIAGTIPFRIFELLNLMFGKKLELIPINIKHLMCNSQNYELGDIELTPQSLSPMCNQLRELKISLNQGFKKLRPTRHVALLAFILRNFRELKNLPLSAKLLCLTMNKLHQRQLQSLDTFNPKTSSMTSQELGTVQWTLDAPFFGYYLHNIVT